MPFFNHLKYEFDSWEEIQEAMENLSDYHDCDKCHGKIVCFSSDGLGNTKCGYCGEIVKYPKLSEKGYELMKKRFKIEGF